MKVTFVIIDLILSLLFLANCTDSIIFTPSFISEWVDIEAQNKSKSVTTIPHNLGQLPVKVDLQIKVTINGEDHIFTGTGSAHRDDDLNFYYGGVVYKYNDIHVMLSTPFNRNGYDTGGIAYVGSPSLYKGPVNLCGPYQKGSARVRVWIQSDMPAPAFSHYVFMDVKFKSYSEVQHSLGYYPELVTVQTQMEDGYISDGQGVISISNVTKTNFGMGGLVFGYDDNKIRLWVPQYMNIFFADDGWNLGSKVNGTVGIKAWKADQQQLVHCIELEVGKNIIHDDTFLLPCYYNHQDYLISVQAKVHPNDGVNSGMMFYGAGSTMGTNFDGFGGILYVYTYKKIMIWRPSDTASNGEIVNIGGYWGGGISGQISKTATVIIRLLRLSAKVCPRPDIVGNASFTIVSADFGRLVSYKCDNGTSHKAGNLIRTCQIGGVWDGVPPVCTGDCRGLENVTNATIISFDNRPGGQTIYQCNNGRAYISGDLVRYCLTNLTWHGSPPVCQADLKRNIQMEDILNAIRVNRKNTSQYRRTLISIWEDRGSAFYLGGIMGSVLVIILCSIILPDLYQLFNHIRNYNNIFRR